MAHQNSDECAACLVNDILACYLKLSQLINLEPSPIVDELFRRLVCLCSQTIDEAIVVKAVGLESSQPFISITATNTCKEKILTDPIITKTKLHLRQLCSEGEYNFEASSENTRGYAISPFPYPFSANIMGRTDHQST